MPKSSATPAPPPKKPVLPVTTQAPAPPPPPKVVPKPVFPVPPPPPIPPSSLDWTQEIVMALPTLDFTYADRTNVLGPLVDNLQGLLLATQRDDCNPGAVDGQGGPLTRQALINFQRVAGLVPDAVCGQETWAKLIEW